MVTKRDLTPRGVMKLTGCSRSTVYRWLREGVFRGVRKSMTGYYTIPREEVERAYYEKTGRQLSV